MRVQRVLMPGTEFESWTVLGDDHMPLEPTERFLSYLMSVEKSPNTVKAYAHDLKDWLTYLDRHGVDWRSARLEDVAGFVAWLRMPPQARDGRVTVLPTVQLYCSAEQREPQVVSSDVVLRGSTPVMVSICRLYWSLCSRLAATGARPRRINRSCTTRSSVTANGAGRSSWRPPRPLPKVLTVQQVQSILDAGEHLRDRLLFALMLNAGVRVGEALGLRHEDFAIAEKTVTVTPRHNDNRARAKARSRTIPVGRELMRVYADYLNREYGALDSDYVFVNLWSAPLGRPWSYSAVYDLVKRLRLRTGIAFRPHLFRHSYATWLLRRGAGMDSVKELLGHASITTTIDACSHLTVEDARQALEEAGWFTGREVRL
jgi:site-specific recombinase XerD